MPRVLRKARNQAFFDDVTRRIAGEAGEAPAPDHLNPFICECSHVGCGEWVLLPVSAYAQVSRDGAKFLVVPGHEDAEHERILVRSREYLIVDSEPSPARSAVRCASV